MTIGVVVRRLRMAPAPTALNVISNMFLPTDSERCTHDDCCESSDWVFRQMDDKISGVSILRIKHIVNGGRF